MVSSGLGGRYPAGYPIGVVTSIDLDSADAFLRVVVHPSARLDQSKLFLLLFREEANNQQPTRNAKDAAGRAEAADSAASAETTASEAGR